MAGLRTVDVSVVGKAAEGLGAGSALGLGEDERGWESHVCQSHRLGRHRVGRV